MINRINLILRAKNITARQFAEEIGIQPSGMSHILGGRNNPSLDFVKKLKETFPEYTLDWIIFGRGPMTVSEPFAPLRPVDQPAPFPSQEEKDLPDVADKIIFNQNLSPVSGVSLPVSGEIKQMIIVYKDNTFEVLSPR